MNQYGFALVLLALVSLASIALWVIVGRHLSRLTETMLALKERLTETPAAEETPKVKAGERFAETLLETEIKKRFDAGENREPPEKYRYVASLLDRGLSSVEIAETLNLSRGEVEQLMALSKVARRGQENNQPRD